MVGICSGAPSCLETIDLGNTFDEDDALSRPHG